MSVLRDVPVMHDEELPIVALVDDGDGGRQTVRHDGSAFYRRICDIGDVGNAFPAFMREEGYLRDIFRKLIDDERMNPLEYSALTWPSKEQGKTRRLENFETLLGFEELNGDDVIRCRDAAMRMAEDLVVSDGAVWTRCGEPCYHIGYARSNNAVVSVSPVFSDQDYDPRPDENYMSALDREAVVREALRLTAGKMKLTEHLPDITVTDPDVFATDFTDRGFVRFASFVSENIAAHLAHDGVHKPGTALLEAAADDVALWLELCKCVARMKKDGTAATGDDDLVMRGADLWKRLGGSALRPVYLSAAQVDHWQSRIAQDWLDRPVRIAASTVIPSVR